MNLMSCCSIIMILIFYKISLLKNGNAYLSNRESEYHFENRFYHIFDNIEDYSYSNLHQESKYRLGFIKSTLSIITILYIDYLLYRAYIIGYIMNVIKKASAVSFKKPT